MLFYDVGLLRAKTSKMDRLIFSAHAAVLCRLRGQEILIRASSVIKAEKFDWKIILMDS